MSITNEKLQTIKDNVPKVYHSGQMDVIKNANSLKGFESGKAILLDDVSPVEHTMGVRVRGKNLIPFPYRDLKLGTSTYNGIDFTVYEDGSILINGTATSNTTRYLYNNATDLLGLKPGITISCSKNTSDDTQQGNIYLVCNYYDSTGTMQPGAYASTTSSGKKTITDNWKGLGIYLHIPKSKTLNNLLIKPQLEIGATYTDYTPYISDLTVVKVSRCGKNLFDKSISFSDTNHYVSVGGEYHKFKLYVGIGTAITVSLSKKYTAEDGKSGYMVAFPNQTQDTGDKWLFHNIHTTMNRKEANLISTDGYISLKIDNRAYKSFKDELQIEIGTTATDYEPYITPTNYTPTADGTVEGVTSLYPNTTLMTDTDGVIIDCDYYKDIDKAFNELSSAIALSGGE